MQKKVIAAIIGTSAIGAIASTQAEAASTHTVKSGESVWSISNKYGISIAKLKSLNGLTSNLIFPNQVLKVSGSTGVSNTTTSSNGSNSSSVYTVQAGDSLSLIASKYGTTYQKIMSLNGLNNFFIYPGQKLKVSGVASNTTNTGNAASASGSVYTVQAGDSLSLIASKYGTTYQKIMSLNGLNNFFIYPGQKLKVSGVASNTTNTGNAASAGSSVYTVQAGDSLSLIASKYGTTYQKIMSLNGLNNFFIYPGQKLKVSGTASPSTANTGNNASNGGNYQSPSFNHQNLYTWGQCTYHVFNRRAQIGKGISTYWWNANNWDNAAAADGYTIDGRATVGSIAQTDAGYYGHVMFVERVNSDGSILVSEMNYSAAPGIVTYRTIPAYQVNNYKYIH
ncbi:autolysin (N-acetylmuramoyl-L-alanine amidase [Staphylococcus simiae]|nr:autolysin (N-acetylmuramoyl-L-alanine amidase [Staphylococcus simiae]